MSPGESVFNYTDYLLAGNDSVIEPDLNIDAADLAFPTSIRITATFFCVVILVLGTTGNILVPIVVCCTKELRNSTNIFLINLSVADLLVLLVCMPTVLIELHSKPEVWVLGKGMCKAVPFVELAVAHGSILTILAISFERYYAICKPLKASYKCTKIRALVIIVLVWVVSVLITSPMLVIAEYTHTEYVDGSTVPICLTQAITIWKKSYFFLITVVFFWVPLIVLLVIYGMISKRLVVDRILFTSTPENSQVLARKQAVVMLAAVMVCFFVCLMPFRSFTIWSITASPEQVQSLGMEGYYVLLYFCRVMHYLNSAINPILYNVISSNFREAFVRLLQCAASRHLLRQGTLTTTSSLNHHIKHISLNGKKCYHTSCSVKTSCAETYV
ncbi:growth hormone secretagogue receptor type 1-like [Limulus polyphemus]|uniref:Growth hormone secretagogue receptor type 1-like n=1 Tax=Limulus polyphemus TaxID=6850 RepID=A0ABM1B3C2_LIMPO|nr:growth hormone secretagogue receptor type 1-like [Limulus polyphemus]